MTKLLCLEDSYLYECDAQVLKVELLDNGLYSVSLDHTVFYPQGGGQPTDHGRITHGDATLLVEMVSKTANNVVHLGRFLSSAIFQLNSIVHCLVDKDRRMLNSRYHTAGHVIDVALVKLNASDWEPEKGDHSPERGAFVAYHPPSNLTSEQIASVMSKLEDTCMSLIAKGTKSWFIEIEPHNIPTEFQRKLGPQIKALKTVRINRVEGVESYWMPCGGTLCKSFDQVGKVSITKYSFRKGLVRICYCLP